MKVFYIMVLVLVAGAVPSHGRTESEGTVFKKTQPHESMNNVTVSSSKLENFNQLYFVVQWPGTFCRYNRCRRPVPRHFTVHGLWPQKVSSSRSIDCRNEPYPPFSSSQLETDRMQYLNRYWPNLKREDNQKFWAREYNKHGSCTFNNQKDYFRIAIRMVVLSHITPLTGIIPGNSYSLIHIKEAVHQVTNKMPMLYCKEPVGGGGPILLWEIRFCASLNSIYSNDPLVDCTFYSNCGNGLVYFPPPSPLRP